MRTFALAAATTVALFGLAWYGTFRLVGYVAKLVFGVAEKMDSGAPSLEAEDPDVWPTTVEVFSKSPTF